MVGLGRDRDGTPTQRTPGPVPTGSRSRSVWANPCLGVSWDPDRVSTLWGVPLRCRRQWTPDTAPLVTSELFLSFRLTPEPYRTVSVCAGPCESGLLHPMNAEAVRRPGLDTPSFASQWDLGSSTELESGHVAGPVVSLLDGVGVGSRRRSLVVSGAPTSQRGLERDAT